MTNWIEWAFMQAMPTPEKLVLVYLATRVNTAGVGRWDRRELEELTGYKTRSVQRLLKVLRDEKLLEDHGGPWYQLGGNPLPEVESLPDPQETAAPRHARPMTLQEIADAEGGGELRAPIDEAEIGEAIANRITDAAEYLGEQLATVMHKFSGEIDRLALLHVEHRELLELQPAAPPAPPPDPVRTDQRFTAMLELGIPEELAYSTVQKALAAEAAAVDQTGEDEGKLVHQAAPAPAGDAQAPGAQPYADTPEGRCRRVKDILTGKHGRGPTSEELDAWDYLEQLENKFTVGGEVEGFLLVYPAIVAAAHREAGRMTLLEFIEPTAVDAGQAPWDQDPEPTAQEDAELEAEIGRMLSELAAVNDPRCQVHGRTVEKKDDGTTVQETMLGYHRRVQAKYREMQKLKSMGVLGG